MQFKWLFRWYGIFRLLFRFLFALLCFFIYYLLLFEFKYVKRWSFLLFFFLWWLFILFMSLSFLVFFFNYFGFYCCLSLNFFCFYIILLFLGLNYRWYFVYNIILFNSIIKFMGFRCLSLVYFLFDSWYNIICAVFQLLFGLVMCILARNRCLGSSNVYIFLNYWWLISRINFFLWLFSCLWRLLNALFKVLKNLCIIFLCRSTCAISFIFY